MNKKTNILIFCMIFAVNAAFAQNLVSPTAKVSVLKYLQKPIPARVSQFPLQRNTIPLASLIAANYYVSHLGFFCKQEIKLEKITRVPFKFRLGSVESCDRLEGKFKYYRFPQRSQRMHKVSQRDYNV